LTQEQASTLNELKLHNNEDAKMDLNLIKRLVRIVDTSGVTDLEIEENGMKVKIAKKIRSAQVTTQPQIFSTSFPQAEITQEIKKELPSQKTTESEVDSSLHVVKSPIVGTFYRAPAPDADAYVQVGDTVSSGSVLCIIEAMKLMNEIESDIDGKIVKILVENGKPVEYNQPLFMIQVA
jgi:acetyl-CoA carboxylase biotin carboxyl carrier protein